MSDNRRHIHLICGTHWDREWRYTYEASLIRLAEVVDATVDACERRPDFRYHLDGGVVILEDYARVRPAMVERLRRLIRDGRVVLSPWYTLPEMFSVAGESTVRNMMYGQRVAEKWGLAPFWRSFQNGACPHFPGGEDKRRSVGVPSPLRGGGSGWGG